MRKNLFKRNYNDLLYKIHVDNLAVNRKKRKVNFAGPSARRDYFCSFLNNPCGRKPKYCDNALERAYKRCYFVCICGCVFKGGDEEDEWQFVMRDD